MKIKKIFWSSIILFQFCSCSFLVDQKKNLKEITIASDFWMPYAGDPYSKNPGFAVEVLQEIFGASGYTIKYYVMDWPTVLSRVSDGEIDIAIGVDKDEAPQLEFAEKPLFYYIESIAILKKNRWKLHSNHPTSKLSSLGCISGYTYSPLIQDFIKKKEIDCLQHPNSLNLNLNDLITGHLDAVVDDWNSLKWNLNDRNFPSNFFSITPTNQKKIELYIAISDKIKKSKEYSELFNNGINQMKKSGRLDQILKKYHLTEKGVFNE